MPLNSGDKEIPLRVNLDLKVDIFTYTADNYTTQILVSGETNGLVNIVMRRLQGRTPMYICGK